MKTLRFGVIGCGLMGKEFASAAARWMHVSEDVTRPEIVAIADVNPAAREWFEKNIPSIVFSTDDYKELLKRDDVDAVYCAVPHVLHEKIYTDIINAGKHLMGEKPFGIDKKANTNILKALEAHPEVFCRCSSEFPFFPAMCEMEKWIREGRFGKILEIKSSFCHSSDMDLKKPINWKRMIEVNGEYGCMGDLGMHTQHVLFRYGFLPKRVSAVLTNVIKERPDGKGGMAACETYDNATLFCTGEGEDYEYPIILETKRLSPGSTNDWSIKITGLDASAYFTTDDPGAFHFLYSNDMEQAWSRVNIGYKPQFKSITGGIFEFGFPDAMLQMWVSYMMEFEGKEVTFGCVRPEETAKSHALITAALESGREHRTVEIEY